MFESNDPGTTRFPVEVRFPYMDVRVARYLLAVPPVPWCADKYLVREAMRGRLPEPVRRRPKAPLAGDPAFEYLKRFPERWRAQPDFVPEMAEFVEEDILWRSIDGGCDSGCMNWINLRPFSLNH